MVTERAKALRDYLDFGRITESELFKKTLGRFGGRQQIVQSDDDVVFAAGEYCQNCQAPLDGRFCGQCGQYNTELRRPIWFLISDLTDDLVSLEGKLSKTLGALLFLPGTLTRNFMEGRRARYIPPIRLYLISTLFFFVVVSLADVAILKLEFQAENNEAAEQLRSEARGAMNAVLERAGVVVLSAEAAPEPTSPAFISPEHLDQIEELGDIDPDNPGDLAEAENLPQEMAEPSMEQAELARGQRELERDLREELQDAFIDLGTFPRGGFEIELPDDMTAEEQALIIENVAAVVDRFEGSAAAVNKFISFGGIDYGLNMGMFEDLAPSTDAVGLPAEIFDDTKADVEDGIGEEIAEMQEQLDAIQAETVTGINETVDRWWRERKAIWLLGVMGFAENNTLKAMDGLIIVSQDPGMLNNTLNAWLPRIMIILLPLFALILRFWYWGRENNLMKQLIFSLHFHSYIFLVMSILIIAQLIVGGAVTTWMFFAAVPLYLLIGMKVASRQGWIRSIFKFTIISVFYTWIIVMTVGLTVMLSLSDLAPTRQIDTTEERVDEVPDEG